MKNHNYLQFLAKSSALLLVVASLCTGEYLGPPPGSVGTIDFRYPDYIVQPLVPCEAVGVYPHPHDCTWYYRCYDRYGFGFFWRAYYKCEPGTQFSDELDQCVFESLNTGCNMTASPVDSGPTTPNTIGVTASPTPSPTPTNVNPQPCEPKFANCSKVDTCSSQLGPGFVVSIEVCTGAVNSCSREGLCPSGLLYDRTNQICITEQYLRDAVCSNATITPQNSDIECRDSLVECRDYQICPRFRQSTVQRLCNMERVCRNSIDGSVSRTPICPAGQLMNAFDNKCTPISSDIVCTEGDSPLISDPVNCGIEVETCNVFQSCEHNIPIRGCSTYYNCNNRRLIRRCEQGQAYSPRFGTCLALAYRRQIPGTPAGGLNSPCMITSLNPQDGSPPGGSTPTPPGGITPIPSVGVTVTPSPAGVVTPSPPGEVTPSPPGVVTPSPSGVVTPSPPGVVAPSPPGEVTPIPSVGVTVTPSPLGVATPSPPGVFTSTPPDVVTPSPLGGSAPSPPDEIIPSAPGVVTPSPPVAVTVTLNPLDGVTVTHSSPVSITVTPSPSVGLTVTPSSSVGLTVTPSPSVGLTVTTSPSVGLTVTPSPSVGLTVTPSPSVGVTVTPSPSVEVTVTSSPSRDSTPASSPVESIPASPGESTPSSLGESTPNSPSESKPSSPGESTPSSLDESTPISYSESTPSSPIESTPSSLSESTPSSPVESTPSSLGESKPISYSESTPSLPGESTPSLPGESTPISPGESTPSSLGGSTPSTSGGIPGPAANGGEQAPPLLGDASFICSTLDKSYECQMTHLCDAEGDRLPAKLLCQKFKRCFGKQGTFERFHSLETCEAGTLFDPNTLACVPTKFCPIVQDLKIEIECNSDNTIPKMPEAAVKSLCTTSPLCDENNSFTGMAEYCEKYYRCSRDASTNQVIGMLEQCPIPGEVFDLKLRSCQPKPTNTCSPAVAKYIRQIWNRFNQRNSNSALPSQTSQNSQQFGSSKKNNKLRPGSNTFGQFGNSFGSSFIQPSQQKIQLNQQPNSFLQNFAFNQPQQKGFNTPVTNVWSQINPIPANVAPSRTGISPFDNFLSSQQKQSVNSFGDSPFGVNLNTGFNSPPRSFRSDLPQYNSNQKFPSASQFHSPSVNSQWDTQPNESPFYTLNKFALYNNQL